MKKFGRTTVNSEIPTASMADIAFLLIIFFMVTAVFAMTKGLEFKLPQQEDAPQAAEEEEAVFIQVLPDASITVDCQPMSHSQILEYLLPKLVNNPEKPVIIYSDPEAPYQGIITVYDVLVSAEDKWKEEMTATGVVGLKVKNISIPTQTDVQDYTRLFGQNPFLARCQ